jgi:hypothetical protein
MFKKVNARERLIGWYHSGPKLRASDLEINELFKRYTLNPLLVIVDVQPKEVGVPTDAYFAVEEIKDVCLPPLSKNAQLIIIGRNNYHKNLPPHTLHNRSRRSRRNWCGTPPPRYSRRRRRNSVYANNFSVTISTGTTSSPSRHWCLPPKGARRGTPGESCYSGQSTRCVQSAA